MGVPRGIAGRSLTYDDEDRLVTVGDDDGFLKKKTDGSDMTEYAYSSRGELLRVELPDGKVIEYVHDPLGRRIAKKVNGTVTEKYLWQGLTRLLAVYNADETLKMRFEYADARMPLAMTKDGVTYYLGYDQVGTLKVVADASGTVVKRIEYDTFGNILSDSDASFAVPFGFAGGLCDKDTGLVRFGYRDYDPETGRWTAKDPILFAGGDTDLYGYCLNDPVNLLDPFGLSEADVSKIYNIFRNSVNTMTEEGRRFQTSYINNILRTLNMISFGILGEAYLGCGEQAEELDRDLANKQYDDTWSFTIIAGETEAGLPHQWLEVKSDNPDDPILTIDPWADRFGMDYTNSR